MAWDLDKKLVMVTISSLKDQWVVLYMRQGIKSIETSAEIKPSKHGAIARRVLLQKALPVVVKIHLDRAVNDYPVNPPAFTLDEADRVQAQREAKRKAKK